MDLSILRSMSVVRGFLKSKICYSIQNRTRNCQYQVSIDNSAKSLALCQAPLRLVGERWFKWCMCGSAVSSHCTH